MVCKRMGIVGVSSIPDYANIKDIASWVLSIRIQMSEQDVHAFFAPFLNLESGKDRYMVQPRARSLALLWRHDLD